ncbi:2,5-diketo-D-gluconate reductase A [Arboricoccus pini]|uniref:2,5-diketo-D-gluconate reductase A n=1 Tax=Arboricoccus pini TaxID=1963835 RepID=A0A212S222_9PROT|nr:aldo/keto reductase [Arboricoccus pini]SNB79123.1 2,5-diketo-D-gluconate reductase A [Arboricoccus pini]
MATQPHHKLNDGSTIPSLGFGVWQVPDDGAAAAVGKALAVGYRHVDTAAIYGNERGVGEALANAGLARDAFYLTTKVWNEAQGYDKTRRAFDESLSRLKLDHVDLYLIHWPSPHRGLYVETWKALVELKKEGRAKAIGVSNFQPDHLNRILDATGTKPVLNQIELHPRFQQKKLRAVHAELGIATEAWSPLGQGKILEDPVLVELARKHGCKPAQLILAWHLAVGNIVIPKSVTPERIVENFAVFDIKLGEDDLAAIAKLDDPAGRIGPDPDKASF